MKAGMTELEFKQWKKDWYIRIPCCEKFSCCHELMSCGIKIFCGDCSIFGTYTMDKNPKECTTVNCDDCTKKYECEDYGKNREISMERRFRKEEENIKRFEEPKRDMGGRDFTRDISREPPKIIKEPKKEPLKKERKDDSLVRSFLNKDIIIMMRGGNKLIGKLESISSYELLITVNYGPVIVLKHAVDYITLVDEGKDRPKEQLEPLKIEAT